MAMSKSYEVVFAHDFCFLTDSQDRVYSAVGLPEIYFDRFFDAGVKHVSIISRRKVVPPVLAEASGFTVFENRSIALCSKIGSGYFKILNPKFIFDVIKTIKKCQLLVVSLPSIFGVYVLILNFFIGKRYSVELAADIDMFDSKRFGFAVRFALNFFLPKMVKRAAGTAYVTQYLAKKFPTEGIVLVSSNVNILRVSNKVRDLRNISDNDRYKIGFVGGLTKRKGIETILRAANKLASDGYNVEFYLVGGHSDGNWFGMASRLGISDIVTFLGVKNSDFLDQFYESLDLYLQPSFSEGLPRASIEAMSYGLPVIASNIPGFCELVSGDMLIPPGDADRLVGLIVKLLHDKKKYMEESQKNIEKSSEYIYRDLHRKRVAYYHKCLEVAGDD